jgi:hypothetical protein
MAATTVSIDDLNIIKKCEDGFEFEYLDAQGKDTGIFFTVLGAHAAKVQKWAFKQLNSQRSQAAILAKRGKAEEVRTVEDDVEFAHELMAIRIIGWRGITQPYTPELAVSLCANNPLIVEQVREASENLANFTKSK